MIIKKIHKLCLSCMEEHEVYLVKESRQTFFKGEKVEYEAIYEYCDKCDEYTETEDLMDQNDIVCKDAYCKQMNLLTTTEIRAIREKYGLTQTDLAIILGWGEKTITRYEGHQVQDSAHDEILRKIENDPEWFLSFLENAKGRFSIETYRKYHDNISGAFHVSGDVYLRKAIQASYAMFNADEQKCGNTELNLDKVVAVVQYFANSSILKNLKKVKLMKCMWYADALSFKRYGHSMMGLSYQACPMGAVPIGHQSLIALDGIDFREDQDDEHVTYTFLPGKTSKVEILTGKDRAVLDTIIEKFAMYNAKQISDYMHKEVAYQKTPARECIEYRYASELSLS